MILGVKFCVSCSSPRKGVIVRIFVHDPKELCHSGVYHIAYLVVFEMADWAAPVGQATPQAPHPLQRAGLTSDFIMPEPIFPSVPEHGTGKHPHIVRNLCKGTRSTYRNHARRVHIASGQHLGRMRACGLRLSNGFIQRLWIMSQARQEIRRP